VRSRVVVRWTPAPVSNIRFDATSDGGLMITGTSVGSVKMLSDDERRLEVVCPRLSVPSVFAADFVWYWIVGTGI
jgi:hypothetical protein